MGKSLNGKELGVGITQRKDGSYQGRFTNRFGKRQTIYDKTLNGIRKKMREAQYEDEKAINVVNTNMTLDEWFEIWINVHKVNCRETSKIIYTTNYNRLRNDLGWRKISSLNLDMMQMAINKMKTRASKVESRKVLVGMLNTAVDCELLIRNPATKIKIPEEKEEERRVLTINETEIFLKEAENNFYYNLFIFLLETGTRIHEAGALQWKDIDFKNKKIQIKHTLLYKRLNGKNEVSIGAAKSKTSIRVIPLTQKCIFILKDQQEKCRKNNINNDFVFFSKRGTTIKAECVDRFMHNIVKDINKKGISFSPISPHTLRHTFATRAIENGMNPKTLQKILGHASIKLTMDLYCHVTEESLFKEMKKMEK